HLPPWSPVNIGTSWLCTSRRRVVMGSVSLKSKNSYYKPLSTVRCRRLMWLYQWPNKPWLNTSPKKPRSGTKIRFDVLVEPDFLSYSNGSRDQLNWKYHIVNVRSYSEQLPTTGSEGIMQQVYIYDALRTPFGRLGGGL